MPVIIDGHNLLWSIHNTGEDRESINDVRLCHIVGRYLALTGERGEIVFDGTGPRDRGRFDNISGLEVFFAGRGADADIVIEDKIKASTAPKKLTVVSSDRRLRDAARARKATAIKSETFWSGIQSRLRQGKPIQEPVSKRQGLTEGETKQWLEFFGLEQ